MQIDTFSVVDVCERWHVQFGYQFVSKSAEMISSRQMKDRGRRRRLEIEKKNPPFPLQGTVLFTPSLWINYCTETLRSVFS